MVFMKINKNSFFAGIAAIVVAASAYFFTKPDSFSNIGSNSRGNMPADSYTVSKKDEFYNIDIKSDKLPLKFASYKVSFDAYSGLSALISSLENKYADKLKSRGRSSFSLYELSQILSKVDSCDHKTSLGTIIKEEVELFKNRYSSIDIVFSDSCCSLEKSYEAVKKAADSEWETAKKKTEIARENYKQAWNAYNNSVSNSDFKLDEKSRALENKYSEAVRKAKNEKREQYTCGFKLDEKSRALENKYSEARTRARNQIMQKYGR